MVIYGNIYIDKLSITDFKALAKQQLKKKITKESRYGKGVGKGIGKEYNVLKVVNNVEKDDEKMLKVIVI